MKPLRMLLRQLIINFAIALVQSVTFLSLHKKILKILIQTPASPLWTARIWVVVPKFSETMTIISSPRSVYRDSSPKSGHVGGLHISLPSVCWGRGWEESWQASEQNLPNTPSVFKGTKNEAGRDGDDNHLPISLLQAQLRTMTQTAVSTYYVQPGPFAQCVQKVSLKLVYQIQGHPWPHLSHLFSQLESPFAL